MTYTATADMSLSRRRIGWSETIALVFAALAWALGAAAWIGDPEQAAAALPRGTDIISFDERFESPLETPGRHLALQPLDRSALMVREMKFRDAKGELARRLNSQDWRVAPLDLASLNLASLDLASLDQASLDQAGSDEPRPSASSDIPLPKSRPVAANLDTQAAPAPALADNAPRQGNPTPLQNPQQDKNPQQDNRTLLQKLSDLWGGRVTLASLTPDGGPFRQGPNLASLGYDRLTAVYDISARAVYLPNGSSLEAHSGMGGLKDNPEHVGKSNVGATPPAVYELKPREQLFHGVRALRMTPVDGSTTLGRSGLLAHSYLLGPNGDSNGCVSIKNYDRFLKAFDDGEINRLVVVPSLSNTISASRSTSRS